MTCKNALVVFDEIPTRRGDTPLSLTFAAVCAALTAVWRTLRWLASLVLGEKSHSTD